MKQKILLVVSIPNLNDVRQIVIDQQKLHYSYDMVNYKINKLQNQSPSIRNSFEDPKIFRECLL